MAKLTKPQRVMLEASSERLTGITKSEFMGSYWRVIDALERHGLLRRGEMGRFSITDAGRAALATPKPTRG